MAIQINSVKQLVHTLAERRKALRISQAELAQLCNLSINGISKFESNAGERDIKLATLLKISQVLGIQLSLEFEE